MKLKSTLSAFPVAFTLMLVSCSREGPASVHNNQAGVLPKNEDVSLSAGDCTKVPGWASKNRGTTGGGSNARNHSYNLCSIKISDRKQCSKSDKNNWSLTITTRLSLYDQSGKTIYGASGFPASLLNYNS